MSASWRRIVLHRYKHAKNYYPAISLICKIRRYLISHRKRDLPIAFIHDLAIFWLVLVFALYQQTNVTVAFSGSCKLYSLFVNTLLQPCKTRCTLVFWHRINTSNNNAVHAHAALWYIAVANLSKKIRNVQSPKNTHWYFCSRSILI